MFVHETLVCLGEIDFEFNRFEFVAVSLKTPNSRIIAVAVYRSPSSIEPDTSQELCKFLEAVTDT